MTPPGLRSQHRRPATAGADGTTVVDAFDLPALVGTLHRDVAAGIVAPDRGAIAHAALGRAPWIGSARADEVAHRVAARLTGLGEVGDLLLDDAVTDILVDGPGPVRIERDGRIQSTELVLDRDGVAVLAERLMTLGRRRVDRRHPTADLVLPGGHRANVVVAPAAVDGPLISIRRFRTVVSALTDFGTADEIAVLEEQVVARRNIVVSGGTGAGKTTLLALLLDRCDPDDRIVTIEDVAELRSRRHLVRLEAQPDQGEGSAPITVRALFRNSLRMRPDRLVIGEVRGDEAADLIQALGTGHRGSMTTVHADDPPAALRRLELLVASAGHVDAALARSQIAAVVDVVVHVVRDGDRRRIASVAALEQGRLRAIAGTGEVGRW